MTDSTSEHASSGAAQTASAAKTGAEQPAATAWRDELPDDLKKAAEHFNSPGDAVRAALNFRRKLSTAIAVPGRDAGEKEWNDYYARLGRPETIEGYVINRPATEAEPSIQDPDAAAREKSFLQFMHKAGATPKVVQAAFDWYFGEAARIKGELSIHNDRSRVAAEQSLRKEWGSDFDRNVEYAMRAVSAFGGDGLKSRLDETGLGDDPAFIAAFARIGRQMGEDDMITGGTDDRRRTLEQRRDDLTKHPERWTDPAIDRELVEINNKLYGTGSETGFGSGPR